MKYLNITGPKDDIDRVVNTYLSKYEIHLENAMAELSTVHDVMPFQEANPYKEVLSKSEVLLNQIKKDTVPSGRTMTPIEASEILSEAYSTVEDFNIKMEKVIEKKKHYTDLLSQLEPFRLLDYDLSKFNISILSNSVLVKYHMSTTINLLVTFMTI